MSLKTLRLVVLLIGSICLGYRVGETAPPAPTPSNGAKTPEESVEVRFARAQVALSESNLKRVQATNERVPRQVPGSVVGSYQQELDVAQTQLQATLDGTPAARFDVWLKRAAATAKSAESQWRGAAAANKRVAGAVDPLDVERFRLRSELAQLDLQRGQGLVHAAPDAQLEWEISLVNGEVEQLREQVRQTLPLGPTYFYWRY